MKPIRKPGSPDSSGKKPYRTPRLKRYGDIRSITRAVDDIGNNDHGHASMTKT